MRFLPILVTDRHRGDLHEGDIKLTHAQRRLLGLPVQRVDGGRQKRAAMKSLARRWMDSNGRPVIPYRIEGSVGEWGNLKKCYPSSTYSLKRLYPRATCFFKTFYHRATYSFKSFTLG